MDVLDRVKDDGRPPGVPPRPFQFTLRTMFIVTTVVAVLCSLLIACPPAVRVIGGFLFLLIYPVAFATVAIYGRSYARTFAIGGVLALSGLTVAGYSLTTSLNALLTRRLYVPSTSDPWLEYQFMPAIIVGVAILTSTLAGLTAVITRWIVERKQRAADRDYRPLPSQAATEAVAGDPSPPEGNHAQN